MRWCCGIVSDSILILWHSRRAMEQYWTHLSWRLQLSWNYFSVVRHLRMVLLARVSVENEILSIRPLMVHQDHLFKSSLWTASREVSSSIFMLYTCCFGDSILSRASLGSSLYQSQEIPGIYLLFSSRNDLADIISSIPRMMWHFRGHRHERLSQILQISIEVVLRCD